MEFKVLNDFAQISSCAEETFKKGWISEQDRNDILSLKDKKDIIVSFIGQMKAGKSTLINALIFGEEILPTSETPETTVLTEIKYGNNRTVVHFISQESFNEIVKFKDTQIDEADEEKKKMQLCYEKLYRRILEIDDYEQYFGTTKVLEGNIHETSSYYDDYIGSKGKYVCLVDHMEIFINDKNIENIVVLDTPGFNDPFAIRNTVTYAALMKSDVILYVTSPDSFLDQIDINKLKSQVSKAGIGKMVICLNHMDEITYNWETEVAKMESRRNVKKQELKQMLLTGNYQNDRNDIEDCIHLIENATIIPCSGIMALLGCREQNHNIQICDDTLEYYSVLCDDGFRPESFYSTSNALKIEGKINEIIGSRDIFDTIPKKKLCGLLETKKSHLKEQSEIIKKQIDELSEQNVNWKIIRNNFNMLRQIILTQFTSSKTKIVNSTNDEINSTFKHIQQQRGIWSELINIDDFKEVSFLSSGVLKKNLNRYIDLTIKFIEDVIRNSENKLSLQCKNLKDNTLDELQREIIQDCINKGFSDVDFKVCLETVISNLKQQMPNVSIEQIDKICIIPDSGNVDQWLYYKNRFIYQDFSDDKLLNENPTDEGGNCYLKNFLTYKNDLAGKMENALSDALGAHRCYLDINVSKSPEENIAEHNREIQKLTETIEDIETYITNIK